MRPDKVAVSPLPNPNFHESELFEKAHELGEKPVNQFPGITDNVMHTPKLQNYVRG